MNAVGVNHRDMRFVGCYIAFPFNDDFEKWVRLVRAMIDLEGCDSFVEGKGRLRESGRLKRRSRLDRAKLTEWIREFETGRMSWINLSTVSEKPDWTRQLEEGVDLQMMTTPEVTTKGNPVIINHFGRGSCMMLTCPVSRFKSGERSEFQERLIDLLKEQFIELKPSWSFVHLGVRPVMPFSVGSDYIFDETREGFPFTSFDYDLTVYLIDFYKEYAKGAFWTNFLNPVHVERLGGIEAIKNAKPCSVIEELEGGGVMLQVDDSPMPRDLDAEVAKYQRLRSFLKPILLETGEDLGNVQRKMLGMSREEYEQSIEAARKNKELRKILKSG